MFKKLVAIMIIVSTIFLSGCFTMTHVVGDGGKSSQVEAARQWYILFGLVPLNNVSSKDMAGGATNYTVKTQQSFLDVVIDIFTGIVTVSSRTIEVTK